jgi:hypothetical protein
MKMYKVIVESINFLINMDEEARKYGFFTTRWVEAWDADEAETKVMDMLRVELKSMVQNEQADSPMMFVEEIEELETFSESNPTRTGFVWYPDNREGH